LPRQLQPSVSSVSAETKKPSGIVTHDHGSPYVAVDPRDELIKQLQAELRELQRRQKATDLQLESLMTRCTISKECSAAQIQTSGPSTSPYASALRAARCSHDTVTDTEPRNPSRFAARQVSGFRGPHPLYAASGTIVNSTNMKTTVHVDEAMYDSPLSGITDSEIYRVSKGSPLSVSSRTNASISSAQRVRHDVRRDVRHDVAVRKATGSRLQHVVPAFDPFT
jgi:hypothetical protein